MTSRLPGTSYDVRDLETGAGDLVRSGTAVPIGKGGMGQVTRAWDKELKRYVALKFLNVADPELEQRLVREARAQARVKHPNICQVYEVGKKNGRCYIAMQLIEGEPIDVAAKSLRL